MTSQRHRRLDAVVARLQLAHGPRAIRRAGSEEKTPEGLAPSPEGLAPSPEGLVPPPEGLAPPPVARIATSFAELDAALDGGLPQGRITEISGPATSGKLTIAAKAIATAHRLDADVLAAWIDPSRSLDPDYMHRCGVDLNRLLVVHPVDLEDVFSIVLHLVESNTLALLVVDSLAPAESHGDAAAALAGQTAAWARLSAVLPDTATALVFLSELQRPSQALAYAAAVRITLRRERWITREDGDVRGYIGHAEIDKNRFGKTGVRATVRITFNGTVRGDGL